MATQGELDPFLTLPLFLRMASGHGRPGHGFVSRQVPEKRLRVAGCSRPVAGGGVPGRVRDRSTPTYPADVLEG